MEKEKIEKNHPAWKKDLVSRLLSSIQKKISQESGSESLRICAVAFSCLGKHCSYGNFPTKSKGPFLAKFPQYFSAGEVVGTLLLEKKLFLFLFFDQRSLYHYPVASRKSFWETV